MVLRFFMLAGVFLFISCGTIERDNPNDPNSDNYRGYQVVYPPSVVSSSAYAAPSPTPSSSSVVSSSSSAPIKSNVVYGTPVEYMGETYQTVVIGTQTWFKRNLNYALEGSKCGGDDGKLKDENTSYCNDYGRLYYWVTAMNLPQSCANSASYCASQISTPHQGICPSGWHIPSKADWNVLMKFINPSCSDNENCAAGAGPKLKAMSGWEYSNSNCKPTNINCNNGTDDYGFSALPSGLGDYDGNSFRGVGTYSAWWSKDGSGNQGYTMWLSYASEDAHYGSSYMGIGYLSIWHSVRCVKD